MNQNSSGSANDMAAGPQVTQRASQRMQNLSNHRGQAPHSVGLLMLAIVTLSGALQVRYGYYDPVAICWLAVTCSVTAWMLLQLFARPWFLLLSLMTLVAVLLGPFPWNQAFYQSRAASPYAWWLWVPLAILPVLTMCMIPWEKVRWKWPAQAGLLAIIGINLILLCLTRLGFSEYVTVAWPGQESWIVLALSCITILAVGLAFSRLAIRQVLFLIILIVQFYLGIWMLHLAPRPYIDTWLWGQKAAVALLHGRNPYTITIPDISAPNAGNYPPDLIRHGRVMAGYVYPPLSLLTSTAGYLFGGDFRYAELAMLSVSALLLALMTDMSREGLLGAVMILFLPQAFFVITQGWIEPCVLFNVMILLFLAYRKPGWLGVGFGLFLVSKQYVFLSAPLVIMLWPRPISKSFMIRFGIQALVTGCIINLPFLLWNPHAMLNSIVPRHMYRFSSLSLASDWAHQTGHWPPAALWWGSVGLVNVLCLLRLPRRPWAFAFGTGTVYLTFFAGASEAFYNYYFLIICLFCVALTLLLQERNVPEFAA